MIDIKYTLGDLINSEGSLLKVSINEDGNIIMNARSQKYHGYLSFEPKFKDFVGYLESKFTLDELIYLSSNRLFSFNIDVELKKIPLDKIIETIPFKDKLYNQVPSGLK